MQCRFYYRAGSRLLLISFAIIFCCALINPIFMFRIFWVPYSVYNTFFVTSDNFLFTRDFVAGLGKGRAVPMTELVPAHVYTVCVLHQYTLVASDLEKLTDKDLKFDIDAIPLPLFEHSSALIYFDEAGGQLGVDEMRPSNNRMDAYSLRYGFDEKIQKQLNGCTPVSEITFTFDPKPAANFWSWQITDYWITIPNALSAD